MRVLLVIAALLFSGCTGITQVRGPSAADLSPADVREIRRLVARPPHLGHTLITLDAIGRDRVRVETREYEESGCEVLIQYVVRRHGMWHIDEHSPPQYITERIVVTS